MKVEKNNVVALSYVLESEGKIVETVEKENALDYIHGTHMLLPLFESNLENKEVGDEFEFSLAPEDAYGEIDDTRVIDIPKQAFELNGEIPEGVLVEGKILPMMDAQGGVIQGTVKKINEDSITMDFNHPMAGKTLNFKGRIESIREATEKELTEGLHGEYLPHECSCGHCHDEEGECNGEGGCGCHGDGECGCHGHDAE